MYCAQADLLKVKSSDELIRLTNLSGAGVIDADVVTRACTNATQVVNGYISPRYTLPVTGADALETLKTIAVRLALYYLHLDRNSLTDDLHKQYDRDIAFLRDIASGKVSLGDPADASEGDAAPGIEVVADDREFTRSKLEDF